MTAIYGGTHIMTIARLCIAKRRLQHTESILRESHSESFWTNFFLHSRMGLENIWRCFQSPQSQSQHRRVGSENNFIGHEVKVGSRLER